MKNQNKYTQQQKDCLDKINNLYIQIKEMSEKKEVEANLYVTDDIDYILDLFNNFTNDPDKKTSTELLSFLSSKTEDKDKCPMVYLYSKEDDGNINYIIIINHNNKLNLAFCNNLNAMCSYLADHTDFPYDFHKQMFNDVKKDYDAGEAGSSEE